MVLVIVFLVFGFIGIYLYLYRFIESESLEKNERVEVRSNKRAVLLGSFLLITFSIINFLSLSKYKISLESMMADLNNSLMIITIYFVFYNLSNVFFSKYMYKMDKRRGYVVPKDIDSFLKRSFLRAILFSVATLILALIKPYII